MAGGVARGSRAVGGRGLRDRRSEPRVAGGDAEDVTAGRGEAPDRQLGRVYPRQRRRVGDRGAPVGELAADPRNLAWATSAFPEAAVVESEHREPGVVEAAGEQVCAGLL